ncbi:PEP-CTERM sorting domain-containing protein [Photobacterium sanctipauli]|uniref:PEP-CTERM sorting domain-containing protein n=2 Tax=Photobacterium sanctipauli TaxID=1342794 RepID=A0A2T3NAJ8_9GAMM|nr:PEP-CTERM sorting domain-containing protein [Photobacterium sanctipauli]PSW10756.1 PEP-CTERM sorting domain-containing protein [Photobacterium sanctipauli]
MNKLLSAITLLTTLSVTPSLAQAAVLYKVSDAQVQRCGSSHGLWTNRDISGNRCHNNYFSIDGMLTINNDSANQNDWTATLKATAMNLNNLEATIDLTFKDFLETSNHYVKEGGARYSKNDDAASAYNANNLAAPGSSDIDFFSSIMGTITIGNDVYEIDKYKLPHTFQFGLGANAKNKNVFGASTWIQQTNGAADRTTRMTSDHWDLNLNLTAVPEPGSLALFGMALIGFVTLRRKPQQSPLSILQNTNQR